MLNELPEIFAREGFTLEEAKFFPELKESFWHVTVVNAAGNVVGAGFGNSKTYARKVAISEFLERDQFRKINVSCESARNEWGLHLIPTGCGFAGGFNRQNVILRSVQEAAERWVMSKWVDDHLQIDELKYSELQGLDPVSKYIISRFDSVRFFRKIIHVNLGDICFKVEVAQTMGLKSGGIFPGSSAQCVIGPIWQHALLESFRHLLFIRNNPLRVDRFPDDKIHFFSKNAEIAMDIIMAANQPVWPDPQILFHKVESYFDSRFFLARTIFDGWSPWNEGPVERFLY